MAIYLAQTVVVIKTQRLIRSNKIELIMCNCSMLN